MQNQLQTHCVGKGVYLADLGFYQVSYFSGLRKPELVKARELTAVLRAKVTGTGHDVRKLYLQICLHISFQKSIYYQYLRSILCLYSHFCHQYSDLDSGTKVAIQ